PAGVEDLLHDVVGRLDLGDLREIGPDRRGADLARLVARDAAALALEHLLARLGVAGDLHLGRRPTPSGRGAGRLRDVVELHVHGAPERFEKRRQRPQLGAIEADRRLVDRRHDRRVAGHDEGARLDQRLDEVRLGRHAWLPGRRARADAREVGRARAGLADPVADLAGVLGLEDLLARLDGLGWRDVAALG